MNKILLVIQREYLSRVKKKSFLLTTLLVPVVIIGFYVAIAAVAVSDSSEVQKVAVIDEANLLDTVTADGNLRYTFITGISPETFKQEYHDKGYDYYLHIPPLNVDSPRNVEVHSQAAISMSDKSKMEKKLDRAIEMKRLQQVNISPDAYKAINSNISISNPLDSGKQSSSTVVYIVSFACGILIYMILLIYGTMVMRGVMEEKMNRIAEVIVSSIKPFQLMLGKIIGIGAVGLTQFAIWITLLTLLKVAVLPLIPGMDHVFAQPDVAAQSGAAGLMGQFSTGLESLPVGLILFCFIFYFLGGYLLYASLFAAIGSVVSEDQQEAQQLVFPVMMPIILAFVMMSKAVAHPDSPMAVFGSLFPLTSPIVMMGRVTYGVPVWQLATSMALLVLTFVFFAWLTAKIYRTGILLYGKKVTWKEMIKWAFRKS